MPRAFFATFSRSVGAGAERVLADNRGLVGLADRHVGIARVGVAERLEILQDLGRAGAAVPGVGQQRDAVRPAVALDPWHRLDPALTITSCPIIAAVKIVGRAPLAMRYSAIGRFPTCDAASIGRFPVAVAPVPRRARQRRARRHQFLHARQVPVGDADRSPSRGRGPGRETRPSSPSPGAEPRTGSETQTVRPARDRETRASKSIRTSEPPVINRGASPLGLPDTLSHAPLRRRVSASARLRRDLAEALRAKAGRSRGSLAVLARAAATGRR